jgi:hypothetical protein
LSIIIALDYTRDVWVLSKSRDTRKNGKDSTGMFRHRIYSYFLLVRRRVVVFNRDAVLYVKLGSYSQK